MGCNFKKWGWGKKRLNLSIILTFLRLTFRPNSSSILGMIKKFLVPISTFIQKIFYVFLDISGILLGLFLIGLGMAVISGWRVSVVVGIIILILGICAFLIHLGHYFSLSITRWIFGTDDYFITRKK